MLSSKPSAALLCSPNPATLDVLTSLIDSQADRVLFELTKPEEDSETLVLLITALANIVYSDGYGNFKLKEHIL
jgi:hypothetical protein